MKQPCRGRETPTTQNNIAAPGTKCFTFVRQTTAISKGGLRGFQTERESERDELTGFTKALKPAQTNPCRREQHDNVLASLAPPEIRSRPAVIPLIMSDGAEFRAHLTEATLCHAYMFEFLFVTSVISFQDPCFLGGQKRQRFGGPHQSQTRRGACWCSHY